MFTARIITGYANVLLSFETPTDLKSGIAVKYCHTFPSKPFLANSSLNIASDSRTASNLSLVIAPKHLTPKPGPGNGCLYTLPSGSPNVFPTTLTSS